MTIDSHQHFWIYDAERDAWINDQMTRIRQNFLPEDLFPILQTNGVDGCVAVQADQSEAETLFLLALAEKYSGFVKGVVGWVDLRAANLYEKLEYYSQYELLKGFRHVAQAEPDDFLSRPEVIKGIRQLTAFDFTYDILIYPTQLKAALHLVRELPQVDFVVDHLAKPYIKDQKINTWSNYMRQLAAQPHVLCKVSGMVTEADWQHWTQKDFYPYLDVLFESFGPERLMFGSDWPVCLVAAEYEQVIGLVRDYMTNVGFSASDRAKVFGENATRFYRLEE
ncbi:amidohydrolase family protein [Runella slithyformis]|uniref:Amidohydrolase 2 n=1 Tax=Runella slithyformis (strain ATCC 29530 / DSM 19594 / LMG 11500 / NCIMB 11436 / LSU 4) TaxID=761193 RepID=A0A7U3ZQR1_RUNSL|nr:amidohydrolase family protein [Runella slithyformis]AEI51634.1 amidohydrolase 2 [Runella slithyformis DSM 19594]